MAIHGGDPMLMESSELRARRAVHPILAWAGIAAPVIFTAVFLVQEAFRREEYDLLAEPVSALEAGAAGWIQQVNFVIFGLLTIALQSGSTPACWRLAAAWPVLRCWRSPASGVWFPVSSPFVRTLRA
jgi:hypothetical protein